MQRPSRPGNILQVSCDYLKQSIAITPQKAYPMKDRMRDCRRRPLTAIMVDMQQCGLLNVDGEFARFLNPPDRHTNKNRTLCDACVILGDQMLKNTGLECEKELG
jgi:hypothetical protein